LPVKGCNIATIIHIVFNYSCIICVALQKILIANKTMPSIAQCSTIIHQQCTNLLDLQPDVILINW